MIRIAFYGAYNTLVLDTVLHCGRLSGCPPKENTPKGYSLLIRTMDGIFV